VHARRKYLSKEPERGEDKPQEKYLSARYTTGEASESLGVSFITIKRWIYSGKIHAEKSSDGKWLISEEEIQRLRNQINTETAEIDKKILDLISKKEVAYLRELQVCLEDEYLHKDTYAALKRLVPSKLNSIYEWDSRWYFPKNKRWTDVVNVAKEKNELMKLYVDHPRRFEKDGVVYMDYSEFFVERALLQAGYTVVAKDTYYFNGIAYRLSNTAGRPTDLDFIAYSPEKKLYLGIQVKNKMEHPTHEEVSVLLEICNVLHLHPILIGRIIHPLTYTLLKNNKGRAVKYKRYFLQPPFPRDKFNKIIDMGIPIGVYKWCPEFLVKLLLDLKNQIIE